MAEPVGIVIKMTTNTPVISSVPFRQDIARNLPDVWGWCLIYRYKIDNSIKFQPMETLTYAMDKWQEMLGEDYRTPLLIQATPWNHKYIPKIWFNSEETINW